jgi:hypothetical protein
MKLNEETHAGAQCPIAMQDESTRGSIFSRAYQRVQSESLNRECIFSLALRLTFCRPAKDRAKDRKYARDSRR